MGANVLHMFLHYCVNTGVCHVMCPMPSNAMQHFCGLCNVCKKLRARAHAARDVCRQRVKHLLRGSLGQVLAPFYHLTHRTTTVTLAVHAHPLILARLHHVVTRYFPLRLTSSVSWMYGLSSMEVWSVLLYLPTATSLH